MGSPPLDKFASLPPDRCSQSTTQLQQSPHQCDSGVRGQPYRDSLRIDRCSRLLTSRPRGLSTEGIWPTFESTIICALGTARATFCPISKRHINVFVSLDHKHWHTDPRQTVGHSIPFFQS